jgi:hypothetical protein
MALIFGNPFDTHDYLLDASTTPRAIHAGVPFEMTFTVRHPRSGDAVADSKRFTTSAITSS